MARALRLESDTTIVLVQDHPETTKTLVICHILGGLAWKDAELMFPYLVAPRCLDLGMLYPQRTSCIHYVTDDGEDGFV
jgi:hypothetical protein